MTEATRKFVESNVKFWLSRWNASEKVKEESAKSFVSCLDAMIEVEKLIAQREQLREDAKMIDEVL